MGQAFSLIHPAKSLHLKPQLKTENKNKDQSTILYVYCVYWFWVRLRGELTFS